MFKPTAFTDIAHDILSMTPGTFGDMVSAPLTRDEHDEVGTYLDVMGAWVAQDAHNIAINMDHVPRIAGRIPRAPFNTTLLGVWTPEGARKETRNADPSVVGVLVKENEEEGIGLLQAMFRFAIDAPTRFYWALAPVIVLYPLEGYERDGREITMKTIPGIPEDSVMHQYEYHSAACEAFYGVVRDVFHLINAQNVTLDINVPGRVKQMMAKKKGRIVREHHTIKLPGKPKIVREPGTGTHASPAMHWRRAHYRTIFKGTGKQRDVFIHEMLVGSTGDGKVTTDYEV